MKQKLKLLFLFICAFSMWQLKAQIPFTPSIIDSSQIIFCNTSPTMAIRSSSNTALFKTLPPTIPAGSFIICGNGKFRIIFRDIINGTGAGFDDATLGLTRRNCVCDVINYIESVISVPSNIGTTDPTIDIIFNVSTNTTTGPLASAAPVYTASIYNGTAPAAYYGGYLYDYITTGVKPDVNSEDAQVNVNFGYPYAYCTSIGDCEYDFYSTILHEITHALGFLSFAQNNSGTLSSSIASQVFSKFDQYYLYYNNGTSFDKLFSATSYAGTGGVNPALPTNAGASDAIWTTTLSLANKQNQPVYSSWPYATGTSLSHFENSYLRCCTSPGYSPNYVMTGSVSKHQLKREYTLQEVAILRTIGYTINSSFAGLSNINNQTPYHAGSLLTIYAGGPTGYMNITPASGLSDLTIATTNDNTVILNLSTGIVSNGITSQSLNFVDLDSDPITVYEPQPGWKGLYNLRGCGNGGNNTNQLSINGARDIITFTPRTNFIGRAQFAFHLYDGIQRGDYVVFTIDVARGTTFTNTPSTELVINGDFEEGTEVREVGANEFNTVADEIDIKPNYLINAPAADGTQIMSYGWNDVFIRNSSKPCLFSGNCFDNCTGTGGSGILPVSNIGDRWMNLVADPIITERYSMTLAEPILPCAYQLEADLYIGSTPSASSTVSFYFHDQGINSYGGSIVSPILADVSYSLTSGNVGTWTHITLPFTYTSTTASPFFQVDAPNYSGSVILDNISLVRTGVSPTLTISTSPSPACTGQTTTLTASGASTYTWSTAANTNSISVSPSSVTVYSVIATSSLGCTSSVKTITVNSTPTITVNSPTICLGAVASLTVSGANSYTWSTGNTFSVTSISPTVTTTYSVTGKTAGCTSTVNATVYVNPLPSGTLTPNGSISLCGSQTITLNAISDADPNTNYAWTYNGSGAGSGHNINVSLAGQYVVTITNTITGCTNTYSTPVYVAPNYVCDQCIVPNGDFEYYATLTNDLGNTTDAPFWNSPTSGSPDYYNTAASGTVVTIPNNVFSSSTPDHTGNVTQGYLGFINYAGSVSEAREYAQTPLNCALEPNQKYNVSLWVRAANGCQYRSNNVGIHFSNTQITGGSNLFTYTPQVNLTSTITSTAWTQLTGTLTGSSANFITIGNFYNDAATTATLVSPGATFAHAYYFIDDVSVMPAAPSYTASTSSCITSGSAVTLTLSGSPGYYITNGVTTLTLNASTGTVVVNPTVTTTYTITPKLTCNKCNIFSTITISVKPSITAVANPTAICLGQASTTLTAGGANTYTWNTGPTTNTISVSPTVNTSYTVTGTNTVTGCTNTKTVTVTVNPNPTVTAVANPTSICVGQTATLTAGGATNYTWMPGSIYTATASVSPTVTTTYTVTGTNTVGCSASKSVTVIVGPVTSTITASSSSVAVCSGGAATLTATGATNYTWMPGSIYTATASVSPSVATIYTLSGNSGAGCTTSTITLLVNPVISTLCCSVANSSITTSTITAGSYAVSGTVIDVSGVITFTGNTSFTGYTFRMKPQTQLRVVGEHTLSLINCKLFSCSELWDGIYLPAISNDIHAHLLLNNTTVEDMYNGIVVEGNNLPVATPTTGILISSTASKLNKNYISIQFRNIRGMLYIPTMTYTNTPYPFTMITTTLSSYASSTSPGSTLKPSSTYTYAYNNTINGTMGGSAPYLNFPRTHIGININDLAYLAPLVVGDRSNSANTNTFDNLDFGINAANAQLEVYNNYFKNITGSTKQGDLTTFPTQYYAIGPDEIGVAIAATHTTSNTFDIKIGNNSVLPSGGNPFPRGNKFEDCNRGIKIINGNKVTALANTFTATTTSLPVVTTVGSPPYQFIQTNPNSYYFYNAQSAIFASGISDIEASFNDIKNYGNGIYANYTSPSGSSSAVKCYTNNIASSSTTGYCLQAIQVDQSGGSTASSAAIQGNTIKDVYRGIAANGVKNYLTINLNDVSIESTAKTLNYSATSLRTGISMSSCSYGLILGNNVTSNASSIPNTPTTANYLTGISINATPNGRVECNSTYQLGRAFVFQGSCANSSWKANAMQDSYRGLEMRLSAVIGQQGANSGTPNLSANTWNTITEETYVLGVSGANDVNTASRFFLKATSGSPKTEPTLNYPTASSQRFQILLGGINVVTGTSYTCNAGYAQRLANEEAGEDQTSTSVATMRTSDAETDSLTPFVNLVQANEDSYEVFADEMMYQNKQFVYQLIAKDSINPASGSSLNAFYEAQQNTAIDKLTEAQIKIAQYDVSGAMVSNNTAPVSNATEQKYQRANELTLKYMANFNYVFTNTEKSDLYNMANECPVKGAYVTSSRNLVNAMLRHVIIYEDNCDVEANASRKAKPKTDEIANSTLFNLFPNPNNGIMTLDYDLGYDTEATMKLFDVTGKLISTYTLQNTKGSISLNEGNLMNGIYFYTILVRERVIKNDKIVVIK